MSSEATAVMAQAPVTTLSSRQWGIVLVVAALQFVNILDFVIVMPIGPRLSTALDFPASHLPWMNGAYTATASLMGLLGALFLDRFDRRKAVGVAVAGLVVGTALCGLANDFTMLLVARSVAGAFGGPATSLCFAIIADTIPSEVRGKAMGTVMGAFSVASVFGVPAGLWLAEHVGWRAPFFVVAALGAVVLTGSIVLLPSLRGHITGQRRSLGELASLVAERDVQLSFLMTAIVMSAGFILIPNIASYLQFNLGVPEAHIKYAYLVGGLASLVATQGGGRLVDRLGSFRVGTVGTVLVTVLVFFFFFLPRETMSSGVMLLVFAGFMLAQGLRNVSYNTLTTKVPDPARRATFQSLQSAVQHGATALAAFGSGLLLTEVARTPLATDAPGRPARMLLGMDHVSLVSMGLSLLIPGLLLVVERRVRARQATAAR
ncbi:MAG: MFS transporter [Myxococcaceae bacterium]|jgi:predicted MFS family arabinose efflux permease|nr:MFS transporter [Myxococcaceae bacterium]